MSAAPHDMASGMSTADVSRTHRDQGLSAAAANGGAYPSNHPTDMLEQQYSNLSMYDQTQQQYKTGAASLLTTDAAAGMASYPQPQYNTSPPYPTASSAEAQYGFLEQQQYQQQQQPLPEDAPAPKTDPVELSLLASYLEVVRQTQGDAAAAEAMAASGADAATLGNAISSPSHTAAEATWPPAAAAAGASPTPAPTAATAAEDNLAVNNLLGFIKQRKLTGLPQMPTSRRNSSGAASNASSTTGAAGGSSQTQQASAAGGRKIWIQPSGPRRPGEGVENEEQGILSAEEVSATGEVMMRITLLAAGFVIGPSGASVREIVRVTGADVNSWTESAGTHRSRRPARIFVIKGEPRCVAQAIYIVTAAVDRYKELCEGRYTGQSVPRSQNVLGVTFSYQPPPKSIVPCAASLKELYAPVNSVAAQAKSVSMSPQDLFSAARMANARALRVPANPYDPAAWTAMMTAAAQMGMNPFAALAGSSTAAAAALGYNPYQNPFGGFNPAAMGGFGVMGGFGGPQNPMMGLAGGGLDHMGAGLGGLGFGMGHLLNPATSAGLLGNTGDMFGGGAGLFGGGLGMEGAHHPSDAAAASAGYGAAWGSALGPSMFDPTGMSALMNAGMFGMPGNAAGAAGGMDPSLHPAAGAGYDHMAAMAAAAGGLHPNAALTSEPAGSVPFGPHLQQSTSSAHAPAALGGVAAATADTGTPTDISGTRSLSQDNSSGTGRGSTTSAMGPRATSGEAQIVPAVNASSTSATAPAAAAAVRPSEAAAPGWHQPGHEAAAAAQDRNIRSRAQLPTLQIPSDHTASRDPGHHAAVAGADSSTTPKSSAVMAGHGGGHGVMHPPPPHSPHMLGHFGPLFHPISPAAPVVPYGPLPGMPAYVAPSPIRIMRDRSGQPVPYMEVGGTTYFPASPMPPPMISHGLFSPPTHRGPRTCPQIDRPELHHSDPRPGQNESGAAGDTAAAAGSGDGGSGDGGPGGGLRGRGRPPAGQTPLRMAGSALRLLEDNPYLVQDTIGSSKSPDGQQLPQHGSYQSSGSSMGSSGSGGRQYIRGGARGSPRRGYTTASPRQQQWQSRRNAGSSNSVGSTGIAAACNDRGYDGSPAAGGGLGPHFDAAAINAALTMPGSDGSDTGVRDNVRDTPTKARYNSQQYKDSDRVYHSDDSSSKNADQWAAEPAAGAPVTSIRPSLSAIPESSIASDCSPPRVGISGSSSRYGSGGRPGGYSQLGAQDPIVSPGRITLASKVKAARFSAAAAHAAATGRTSPGSTE